MNIVAIIPARAGSKRLKGKNWRELNGKPLICYSIEEAIKCDFITEIIVSTDSLDIMDICQKYYDEPRFKLVRRPKELAQDDSLTIDVILQAFERYRGNTIVILLQPTSPLRISEDIGNGFTKFMELKESVISVFKINELDYRRNGAVFVDSLWHLRKNKGFQDKNLFIMPKERSMDIDMMEDFIIAGDLLRARDVLNKKK